MGKADPSPPFANGASGFGMTEGKSRSLPAQAAHEDARKKKRPASVRDDNFFWAGNGTVETVP